LADGPAWSSSTAYYAGRGDDDGRGNPTQPANPAYGGGHPNDGNYHPGGQPGGGYAPQYDEARDPRDPRLRGQQGYQPGYDPAYTPSPTPRGYDPNGAPIPASRSAARAQQRETTRQRGLPGWVALLILLAIAGIGGIIDISSGNSVRGGFNIALVVASLIAIVVVRHRDMFPIVVAPPLVYIVASGVLLYIRSGGLHNRHVLIDTAANGLVYGFPAIAGATAAVLIVAGIRLVSNK
jgi:hypothetical protein